MPCREIIAVCSQIHTKHINALCGQNVEFVRVKPDGAQSNDWALKGYSKSLIKTKQRCLKGSKAYGFYECAAKTISMNQLPLTNARKTVPRSLAPCPTVILLPDISRFYEMFTYMFQLLHHDALTTSCLGFS
jgi:hypothetical protein